MAKKCFIYIRIFRNKTDKNKIMYNLLLKLVTIVVEYNMSHVTATIHWSIHWLFYIE